MIDNKLSKLLIVLIAFCSSAFSYDQANMNTIAYMKNDDNSGQGLRMYIFTLKHDETQLYCTGIVTSDELSAMSNSRQYTGHVMTRADYIGAKKRDMQFSDSDWSRRFANFDGNGNGIGDWKEMVAGGEPLYWTSCGNGWQFYVGGQMLCCNSDTDWENVPYKQMPEAVQTQYPDENHNGIPDIVDAAIAAGGGATSEGGNITVTVENKTINVQVDNTEVLQALQGLSQQIAQINVSGGSGGSEGEGGHCDALQLKPYFVSIVDRLDISNENQGALINELRGLKKEMALLLGVFYDGIDWREAGFNPDFPNVDDDDPVLKPGAGGIGFGANQPIQVEVVGQLPLDVAQIKDYLLNDQKANLDKIVDLLEKATNSSSSVGSEVEESKLKDPRFRETVADQVEKSENSIMSDVEKDNAPPERITEHESNLDKNSVSAHFAKRFFALFDVDYDKFKETDAKQASFKLGFGNGRLTQTLGLTEGAKRFTLDIPLADEEQDHYDSIGQSYLSTLAPIKETVRLVFGFVLFWAFLSAMLGLLHSAWSY